MSSRMLGGVEKAVARRSFREAVVESLRGGAEGRGEKAGAGVSVEEGMEEMVEGGMVGGVRGGAGEAGGKGGWEGEVAGASIGDVRGAGEAMGCSGCAADSRTSGGERGALGVGTMGGGRVDDSMEETGCAGEEEGMDGMVVGEARGEKKSAGGVKGEAWRGAGEVGAMGVERGEVEMGASGKMGARGGVETRRGEVESGGMEGEGGMMMGEVERGLLGVEAETEGVSEEVGGEGGRVIVSGVRRSSISSTMLGGVEKVVARRSLVDVGVESLRGEVGGVR